MESYYIITVDKLENLTQSTSRLPTTFLYY